MTGTLHRAKDESELGGENLPCAFGLGRIMFGKMPESVHDIDQGVGAFIQNEKYLDKGWQLYREFILSLDNDAKAALGMIKDAESVDRSSVDPAKLAHAIKVINEELYWYSFWGDLRNGRAQVRVVAGAGGWGVARRLLLCW